MIAFYCGIRNLNEFVFTCVASQDARDGLLGRLFAYGSLFRVKRLIGNGTSLEEKELAKEIVEQLLTLAKQKPFLRESDISCKPSYLTCKQGMYLQTLRILYQALLVLFSSLRCHIRNHACSLYFRYGQ